MKRLVMMIFCGIISYGIKAQSASSPSSTVSQSSRHQRHKTSSTPTTLSNRKVYGWKDGQRATPTGHSATSSNGDNYAALGRDTSRGRKNLRQ